MMELATVGATVGMMTARHAGGSLTIGGIDLLLGLASQSVLSFTWTDNTSDMADDLSVEIADPARTWMQTYLPKKGVEGTATIQVYNWNLPGDTRTIDCGVFWLDQIDFAGPPNTVAVKATSVPVITGIKNQKRFYSWEGTDLYSIAQEIATKNGLTLVWDTAKMPEKFERVDQVETPDLEFIRDKVKEASLCIKIFKKQLVIYSEEEYEARPPVYTLTYGMSNIIGYSFSSKLDDTYKKAKNSYVNPKTGNLIEEDFEPEEPPEGSGSDEELNERSEEAGEDGGGATLRDVEFSGYDFSSNGPSAESAKIPKAKLRDKNKYEKECSIVVVGNPDYLSGLNVQLIGFGIFDGKWFISSTIHNISSNGYVTELVMRACLKGY